MDGGRARLLGEEELTAEEGSVRDQLLDELLQLRDPESPAGSEFVERIPLAGPPGTIGGGTWCFPDRRPVTIVCARLPQDMRARMPYTDSADPDYVRSYQYADLDGLIELYGHVRAVNPAIDVTIKLADELEVQHYTNHLVLLGGVDWNPVVSEIMRRLELPIRQRSRPDDDPHNGYFELGDGEARRVFVPKLIPTDRGMTLVEDVAHFFRGANPFNKRRTLTLCNGMYGRGTYGVVRALTHSRFRDRNEEFIDRRFARKAPFGVLTRVTITPQGEALTPDWTVDDNRLHTWPGVGD